MRNVALDFGAGTALTWEPVVAADPTYADRDVTINPGQNWQTIIDGQSAGTESNPIIFGITAGTHARAQTLNTFPKSHHWFVGESNGTPTATFPNGSPLSKVDGTRTAAAGTDMFFGTNTGTGATGVKMVMLEIDGFSPISVRYVMGGPSCNDWYLSHVDQHHSSEGGIRLGWGMNILYSRFHHNGRDGMTAHNQQPSNEWLQGVLLDHVTVDYNNQFSYEPNIGGSHAGGSKFIATRDMEIRYCDFSRNGGPGIWFDSFSTGLYVHHNTAWDNLLDDEGGSGIFLEILDCTTGARVEYNDVRRNGDAANIYISNARGTSTNPILVRHNYTENHRQWEIMGSNVNRDPFPELNWTEITDNTMVHTQLQPTSGGARALSGAYIPDAGEEQLQTLNMFWDRNHYTWSPSVMGTSNGMVRNAGNISWASWQGFGYDPNSTFVTV